MTTVEHLVSPDIRRNSRSVSFRVKLLGLFLLVSGGIGLLSGGHMYSIDDELKYNATEALAHGHPYVDNEIEVFPDLYRQRDDGRSTTVYGIGQSAIALPFYATGRIVGTLSDWPANDVLVRTFTLMTNAVVAGATAVVLALLSRELRASDRGAILLSLVYAFGTYSVGITRTFGAEPGTALMIVASCWLAFRGNRLHDPRLFALSGLAIGLSASFRVSALSFAPLVAVFVVGAGWTTRDERPFRSEILAFIGGGAVAAVLLAATNWWRYGDPAEIGYAAIDTSYPLHRGLVNVYFSLGKSFFLYAPVCIVSVAALVASRRRVDARVLLLLAIIALNSYTIARLPVWAGDSAWGPRYMQVVLPCAIAISALVVDRINFRRAIITLGIVGAAVPAFLGTAVAFDVFTIDAQNALGAAPVASENGQPAYNIAMKHDIAWNPILGHLELLPEAVRDTFGVLRDDEIQRSQYLPDPYVRYGFFGETARLDVWWLWVEPTGGSKLTYVLLLPLVSAVAVGAWLLRYGARMPLKLRSYRSWEISSGSASETGELAASHEMRSATANTRSSSSTVHSSESPSR
jgi:hypothetical protein